LDREEWCETGNGTSYKDEKAPAENKIRLEHKQALLHATKKSASHDSFAKTVAIPWLFSKQCNRALSMHLAFASLCTTSMN